jgi:hypothetical protein
MTNTASFTINVVGDITGEQFYGAFKTKVRLSHRDQFRQDQMRRELLGTHQEAASPRAANAAEIFSTINIHLVDAPNWWKDADNGLALEDDNVVGAIWESIMRLKVEAAEELKKKAQEAKGELQKLEPK